ncbi:T9SS type B sorting domain-containing protein [Flavobacterium lacisediminis]|uniref:T9SS type B sorting domain-containing protein n=1 Tax=Flavobacterium lacisediminis TaxID=2989705 RepID=A0ABT3EG96_9FLAO|nr:T9SS type B sorting domain-containing protein [Flavobacterium lacisediminis]
MKIYFSILFLMSMLVSHAQGEANIWYFGQNAGLDFNSGVPITLTNGQLVTDEGCATISNSSGQLLFYTDGVTVYNKNHTIMVNGTGLLGHSSSMQSATIVPKPGSSNLFYIFTTDAETLPNGFRYSVVDMNLDGGNGAVTSAKNILVYTPTTESLGITKHANGIDFWVVTHEWNNNNFNAHLLTASGLSSVPVTTSIGLPISGGSGFEAAGSLKLSPSGSKLAITSVSDFAQLYDFDANTGVLSNVITLTTEAGELSGIAFSPDESLLYISNSFGKIHQFNLNAADIPNSIITIYNGGWIPPIGQMQVGPDNKIYVAVNNRTKLGVINNPNILGLGCNFVLDGIDLSGRLSKLGLPSFNQSFFAPSIRFQNSCVGEVTQFQLGNATATSAIWNFGDGNTSNSLSPIHTYTAPGTYTVSVTATSSSGTGVTTRDIIISAVPTATQPNNISICDDNNDGFYNFDLTSRKSAILNGQSESQFNVRYFANATNYSNNVVIANPTSFPNTTAYQSQTIIAEVYNIANPNCKTTTTFDIQVFESPRPSLSVSPIQICDNTSFGTDTDGRVVFNLTSRQGAILNGQSSTNFTVSYYKDAALTDLISNPTTYVNSNLQETIYVKVANNQNTTCFATTSFQIEVFSLPVIITVASLKQCDDNNDGYSAFNLTQANALLVGATSGLTFSYFETSTEAQSNTNSIPNFTAYTNQTVSTDQVFVRVQNSNGCFRVATLNLVVSTTQISNLIQEHFYVCDDVASGSITDGIATFDFSSANAQIASQYPSGQLLDITYYRNIADALAEQNAIIDISHYTNIGYPNTQNIYVRVDSQLNNECIGLGHHITLHVERIPIIQPRTYSQCDDNHDGFFAFNITNLQSDILNGLTNVTLSYWDANNNPLPSPLPNPFNTTSQIIRVRATNNTTSACYYESTITFKVDDLPEAFAIPTNLTTVCDDEANPINQDGIYPFDTSSFQNTIIGTQTGMIVNYFDGNGNSLSSPLPNPFLTTTQNIRVEVINPLNTTCKAYLTIPLVVYPVPEIELYGDELICSNNPLFTKEISAGLLDETTVSNYTYQWFLNNNQIIGETNYILTVNTEGIYTVEVTNSNGCVRTRTLTVTASNIATIDNVQVVDLSDENSVTVLVTGLGDYEYSLDNENWQTSNVFTNIEAGIYTVYVKDLNGCGVATEEISVLGIPNYFTPNGDGYNDYWNIKGINNRLNAETIIYIFDRYGKLINQINPLSQGWDGTFNGNQMPSSDYWYSVQLEDGRVVKGHFSLKR